MGANDIFRMYKIGESHMQNVSPDGSAAVSR